LLGIRTTRLFVSIPQLAQRRNQTVQQAVDARHRLTLQGKKTAVAAIRSVAGAFLMAILRAIVPRNDSA
jgi:hypothetical protein